MYFPPLNLDTGCLLRLAMTPTRTCRFRINRAPDQGKRWLFETLNRERQKRVEPGMDHAILLRWN